jgi:hypothetical protein
MKLKLKYSSQESIPAGYEDLFTEKDGEWHLTGIEGMKTQGDIDKLQTSLKKERDAHKATKDKLAKLGGDDVDIDQMLSNLDELEDLRARIEAGEGGKIDEDKFNQMVEQRINRQLKPIERERDQLKSKVTELEAANGELKGTLNRSTIETKLRELATNEKVVTSALDDILFIGTNVFELSEDGEIVAKAGARGISEGTTPDVWLSDMKEKRPHWWPQSQGGGAGGGKDGGVGGSNPWSAKYWDLDAQAAMVRTDRAKAERFAKAAGSKIGSVTPPTSAA